MDESGNSGTNLEDPGQPIHWVVALAVRSDQAQKIENGMVEIGRTYFPLSYLDADFEFHGREIYQGEGPYRDLVPPERVAIYQAVLRLITACGVKVFVRGIDKRRHLARSRANGYSPYHPHQIGVMYLLEAVDEWLAGQGGEEFGLVVADEQREMQESITKGFAIWRLFGTDHGYKTRQITNLIDTVHFVPSNNSWLLQLADCTAYALQRYWRLGEKHGWVKSLYTDHEEVTKELWAGLCAPNCAGFQVWPKD